MDDCSLPQRLERKTIYESDYVCLYADRVELPGGTVIEKYHQIHYPHEAVSVVIFNEKNEVNINDLFTDVKAKLIISVKIIELLNIK